MRRTMTIKKHSGKIVLPTNVINGMTPKTALKLADTSFYQVGLHGDYVQEAN